MNNRTTEYLHIVPVGLSILTNSGWKYGERLPAKKDLIAALRRDPRRMSAELNGLIPFIERGRCSSVHLIGTGTPPNKLSRDVVAHFLQERRIHITRAEARGLAPQPLDLAPNHEAFYEAVRRFRGQVFRVVRHARERGAEILINATGGLKAEVAVAALIAAEFSLSAYYIHESMAEPVFLPTVALDRRLLHLLRRIHESTGQRRRRSVAESDLRRLEQEALVKVSRTPDGEVRNIRLTRYAKSLLTRPALPGRRQI